MSAQGQPEISDSVPAMLNSVCKWLETEGVTKEEGILLVMGNVRILRELHRNEYFVPSLTGRASRIFEGTFKNYPVIRRYEEETGAKCIAMKLTGWAGIAIRQEILAQDTFGSLSVCELSKAEIDEALKDKDDARKRLQLQGQCRIKYELFWEVDKKKLPEQFVITLRASTSSDSTEPLASE